MIDIFPAADVLNFPSPNAKEVVVVMTAYESMLARLANDTCPSQEKDVLQVSTEMSLKKAIADCQSVLCGIGYVVAK